MVDEIPPKNTDEPIHDDFERFVYLLSHDVRNSARAVMEIPHWIEEDLEEEGVTISEQVAEHFTLLHVHTKRLDQMLVDLLMFSRVGRKQSIRTVSLCDAMEQVLNDGNIPEGFNVITDLQHDRLTMGQNDVSVMLAALVSNSIRHHHLETGIVHVSSRREGDVCILNIKDDGPGIEKRFQDLVFEIMKTLKSRDDVEGSGIGLAIVKKIVLFYGGTLRWVNEDGVGGTNLEIRLPI